VTLDALEDLLLHLEPHLIFAADAALQRLDRDRPAQGGLRLDPALLAEVALGEPAMPPVIVMLPRLDRPPDIGGGDCCIICPGGGCGSGTLGLDPYCGCTGMTCDSEGDGDANWCCGGGGGCCG